MVDFTAKVPCRNCFEEFEQEVFWQRFCSPGCRQKYHKERQKKAVKELNRSEKEALDPEVA